MKKVLFFLVLLVTLTACQTPSNQTVNEAITVPDNFRSLSDNVLIIDDIVYPEEKTLNIYDVVEADRDRIHSNILSWLGDDTTYDINRYDNVDEIEYNNHDVTFIFPLSSDETNIVFQLTTSQARVHDSLFHYYTQLVNLDSDIANKVDTQNLSFFSSDQDNNITQIIDQIFNLVDSNMDYDVAMTDMSQAHIEYTQEETEQFFNDEKDFLPFLQEDISPFYHLKISPKIDEIPVIDERVSFGSTDQINVVGGTMFNLILEENKIHYLHVSRLRLPGSKMSDVDVSHNDLDTAITTIFNDLILEEPVQIHQIDYVYAPIPDNNEDLYRSYQYRPLIRLKYTYMGEESYRYLDPETNLEVR